MIYDAINRIQYHQGCVGAVNAFPKTDRVQVLSRFYTFHCCPGGDCKSRVLC